MLRPRKMNRSLLILDSRPLSTGCSSDVLTTGSINRCCENNVIHTCFKLLGYFVIVRHYWPIRRIVAAGWFISLSGLPRGLGLWQLWLTGSHVLVQLGEVHLWPRHNALSDKCGMSHWQGLNHIDVRTSWKHQVINGLQYCNENIPKDAKNLVHV